MKAALVLHDDRQRDVDIAKKVENVRVRNVVDGVFARVKLFVVFAVGNSTWVVVTFSDSRVGGVASRMLAGRFVHVLLGRDGVFASRMLFVSMVFDLRKNAAAQTIENQ